MDETVSARNFAFGVLSIAKDLYGEQSKYITKTRAIKLVCLTADKLEFEGITRGWYNFGEYSFGVDSIIKPYFSTNRVNLLGANIPTFDLADDGQLRRVIKDFKPQFIKTTPDFMRWIHYIIAPDPYKGFYKSHDNFLEVLCNIGSPYTTFTHPRDLVGEIINSYNPNLRHLSRERRNLFFDFTDILEDLLLVAKVRSISLPKIKNYFISLKNIYQNNLYPCLTPFEQTVHGSNREGELKIFQENTDRYRFTSINALSNIDSQISNAGLKPTFDEYDVDILEGIKDLSDKQKEVFDNIFKYSAQPSP